MVPLIRCAGVFFCCSIEKIANQLHDMHVSTQVLSLAPEAVNRGLVTCSTGNHALAFLHACTLLPMREG